MNPLDKEVAEKVLTADVANILKKVKSGKPLTPAERALIQAQASTSDSLPVPLEQAALFSPDQLPNQPVLIEAAKKFIHTGKITCKNDELAAAVCQDMIQHIPQRTIAKRYHISVHTIHAIMDFMESSGKLATFKKRMSGKLAHGMELGIETAIEMLADGKVQPNVVPVMVGVFAEKKAMIDGDPALVVEHRHEVGVKFEDFLTKFAQAKSQVVPIQAVEVLEAGDPRLADCTSVVDGQNGQEKGSSVEVGAVDGAGSGPGSTSASAPGPDQVDHG